MVCGASRHFQQYFSYIVDVSFIGEETRVSGENHRPVASHLQTLSQRYCIEYTSLWSGFELTTLVVIGADCTGNCKSNYHTITTTTVPLKIEDPLGH